MNYKLEIYDGSQDLTEFFKTATEKKFYNNNSKEMLIDYIAKYENSTLFLLYYKNKIVGTTVSHSLDELGILGQDAYRVAARTCVFTDMLPGTYGKFLRTSSVISQNQNPTSQFLIPICIAYTSNKPIYITTNDSKIGSQDKVHRIWSKIMHNHGFLTDPIELEYKRLFQTFWKVDVEYFLQKLKENQWPEARLALRNHLGYDLI
jgi:hypothetical protein